MNAEDSQPRGLLKSRRVDLHVHTVLSPCAGVEMIPPLIVEEALAADLCCIAITDHNATANIAAVMRAAQGTPLTVMPGVELQTREELHTLCLFDTLEQAAALQSVIDARLPSLLNNPDFFGEQFVVDHTGEFIRREERLLLNSLDLTLHQAFHVVDDLGGLFIPAHINRKAFGMMAVLGLLPNDIPLEAVEISRHITPADAMQKYPQTRALPMIQNGDVHYLDGFLGSLRLKVEAFTIAEIRMALRGQAGRSYKIA